MTKLGKLATFTLIITLLASSLLIVKSVSAQSIPKPSTPDFTLKLAQYPYEEPPVTTVDPYTGKIVTTQESYRVDNKSIEVTIKNQPFRAANGSLYGYLHYDVFWKGHFETDWHSVSAGASCCEMYSVGGNGEMEFVNPNEPYTVVSFGLGDNPQADKQIGNVSDDGQIDFRIQAFLGTKERVYGAPVPPFGTPYNDVFKGEQSDYSETQTINMVDGSVSVSAPASPAPTSTPILTETSNAPTPTQIVPEFPELTILPLFIVTTLIIAIKRRK